jgi:hypothetical protein
LVIFTASTASTTCINCTQINFKAEENIECLHLQPQNSIKKQQSASRSLAINTFRTTTLNNENQN